MLDQIFSLVQPLGFSFQYSTRLSAENRIDNSSYWSFLKNSYIVLTTSTPTPEAGSLHLSSEPHFIYRFVEALATKSLLLTQAPHGISHFFEPDIHFVSYSTPLEASQKITYLFDNPDFRHRIAAQGYDRVVELIKCKHFWSSFDGIASR